MSLYNETIEILRREKEVSEFYRFQGAKSFDYFDIRTSRFIETPNDSYTYFSGSLDHHKYFSNKRIKQFLNKTVLEGTPYQIASKDLRDLGSYHKIRRLILNTDKLQNLYSIRLITDSNFKGLIRENCFPQEQKKNGKPIERVDRRVYGGGYGVAAEWKDLFNYLTYFDSYQRIDRYDILELLSRMRTTGKVNQKDNLNFLLQDSNNYRFELSPSLESDFTKYKIKNALESILEKGLYAEGSTLATNPDETIKTVVEDYERKKEKVLTLFDGQKK